jgi:hypothetical protein
MDGRQGLNFIRRTYSQALFAIRPKPTGPIKKLNKDYKSSSFDYLL